VKENPHYNRLTPAETERLALLIEECAEVQHTACKILRHGYNSCFTATGQDNRSLLENKLGDLMFALRLMRHNGDMQGLLINQATERKVMSAATWLHHHLPAEKKQA
jgi:hypothetical protein